MLDGVTQLAQPSDPRQPRHRNKPETGALPPDLTLPPESRAFWAQLLDLRLLPASSARRFLEDRREHLSEMTSASTLGNALVQENLVTAYQVDQVLAGMTHGLVLGPYRVRQRLGAGGFGVVFL